MIKLQPKFLPSEATDTKTNLSSSLLYSKDLKGGSNASSESYISSVMSALLQMALFGGLHTILES